MDYEEYLMRSGCGYLWTSGVEAAEEELSTGIRGEFVIKHLGKSCEEWMSSMSSFSVIPG